MTPQPLKDSTAGTQAQRRGYCEGGWIASIKRKVVAVAEQGTSKFGPCQVSGDSLTDVSVQPPKTLGL